MPSRPAVVEGIKVEKPTAPAARLVADRRQPTGARRPHFREDDLVRVRVDDEIGVVRDYDDLPASRRRLGTGQNDGLRGQLDTVRPGVSLFPEPAVTERDGYKVSLPGAEGFKDAEPHRLC